MCASRMTLRNSEHALKLSFGSDIAFLSWMMFFSWYSVPWSPLYSTMYCFGPYDLLVLCMYSLLHSPICCCTLVGQWKTTHCSLSSLDRWPESIIGRRGHHLQVQAQIDHYWMPSSSSTIFLLQCLSLLLQKQTTKCSLLTGFFHLILLLSRDVHRILVQGWISFNPCL